jgi:hypothetical protein
MADQVLHSGVACITDLMVKDQYLSAHEQCIQPAEG